MNEKKKLTYGPRDATNVSWAFFLVPRHPPVVAATVAATAAAAAVAANVDDGGGDW
jgi:hypothetical protein